MLLQRVFAVRKISSREQARFLELAAKVLGREVNSRLSVDDGYALLTWRNWADEFGLPVAEIADVLLQHWERVRLNSKRRTSGGDGLPVRVNVLTGKASRMVLIEYVLKNFPNGENLQLARQDRQRRLVRRLNPSALNFKMKNSYETPSEYMRAYRALLKRNARLQQKAQTRLRNLRPFRGNPWIAV